MHAATIYDAGGDDKLVFFFHGPNHVLCVYHFLLKYLDIEFIDILVSDDATLNESADSMFIP